MQASDIMTATVATLRPESRLEDAIRTMLTKGVSGIPVTDGDGGLLGIVTEGDLLRRAEIGTQRQHSSWLSFLISDGRRARDYFLSHARRIGDVMTTDVIAVTPETSLEDIVTLMEKRRIKRVPVLQDRRLVGIVARSDILRAVIRNLAVVAQATDESIHEHVLGEIAKQSWAPHATIDVAVKDGIVELRGTIIDERFRNALRVIAENVPGVKSVQDRLVCIEPISGVVIDPGT